MRPSQSILVVDDDIDIGTFISVAVETRGLHCNITTNGASFIEALRADTTLVILDLLIPDMDGMELLKVLGERRCKAGIVLMSGVPKRVVEAAERLALALNLSIVGRLSKPFSLASLDAILTRYEEHSTPGTEYNDPRCRLTLAVSDGTGPLS